MSVPGLKFKKDADNKIEYFCKNTDFKSMSRSEIIDNFEWVLERILDYSTNNSEKEKRRYFLIEYASNNRIGSMFVDCIRMFNFDELTTHAENKYGKNIIITGYQEMSKEDYFACSKKNN